MGTIAIGSIETGRFQFIYRESITSKQHGLSYSCKSPKLYLHCFKGVLQAVTQRHSTVSVSAKPNEFVLLCLQSL